MRIGIDTYPLIGQYAGIGIYLYNIIKYLEKIDKENEYFLYAPNAIKSFEYNPKWRIRITKGFFNKSGTFWKQTRARKDLLKDKIDLFWAPNAILPANLPNSIKTVLTVHDLTYVLYPKTLKWDNKIIFPLFFRKSLKKAGEIIAVSESTANEIRKFIPEINNKISIIYEGISGRFKLIDKYEAKKYISKEFNISQKYILTVLTLEPRKNLNNLLKAFLILIRDNPRLDYQLLIAGGSGWRNSNIYKTYQELNLNSKQVKFLGYVHSDDLIELYSGAEIFVFSSLYEGFGLPPLEAMACGTPVVASDIPVFREILGDAALLVDPFAPEKIANAIYRVLTDNALAKNLMQKGIERIKLFSWETTAKETLGIFEKIIRRKNNG